MSAQLLDQNQKKILIHHKKNQSNSKRQDIYNEKLQDDPNLQPLYDQYIPKVAALKIDTEKMQIIDQVQNITNIPTSTDKYSFDSQICNYTINGDIIDNNQHLDYSIGSISPHYKLQGLNKTKNSSPHVLNVIDGVNIDLNTMNTKKDLNHHSLKENIKARILNENQKNANNTNKINANTKLDKIGTENLMIKTLDLIPNQENVDNYSTKTISTKHFESIKGLTANNTLHSIQKKLFANNSVRKSNTLAKTSSSPLKLSKQANISPIKGTEKNIKLILNASNRNKGPQKTRVVNLQINPLNNINTLNTFSNTSNESFLKTKSLTKLNRSLDSNRMPPLSLEKSFNALHNNDIKNICTTSNSTKNINNKNMNTTPNVIISISNPIEQNKKQIAKTNLMSKNKESNNNQNSKSNLKLNLDNQKIFSIFSKNSSNKKYDKILTETQIKDMQNNLLDYYNMLIESDIPKSKILENMRNTLNIFIQKYMENYNLMIEFLKDKKNIQIQYDKLLKEKKLIGLELETLKQENKYLKQCNTLENSNFCKGDKPILTDNNRSASRINLQNSKHDLYERVTTSRSKKKNKTLSICFSEKEKATFEENVQSKKTIQNQEKHLQLMPKKEEKNIKLLIENKNPGVDIDNICHQNVKFCPLEKNITINSDINSSSSSIYLPDIELANDNKIKDDGFVSKRFDSEDITPKCIKSRFLTENNTERVIQTKDHKENDNILICINEKYSKHNNNKLESQCKSLSNSPFRFSWLNNKEQEKVTLDKATSTSRSRPNIKLNLNLLRNSESADCKLKLKSSDENKNNEFSEPIGFHQEFMSKIDEFSLSWRQAAMKERKIE